MAQPISLVDVLQGSQAMQQAQAYPELLQQQVQGGALDIQNKSLDVQQKQISINQQKSIADSYRSMNLEPTQTPKSALEGLKEQEGILGKQIQIFEKAGDISGANKIRENLIKTEEKRMDLEEKAHEHSKKEVENALVWLQDVKTPEDLAAAKMELMSGNLSGEAAATIAKLDMNNLPKFLSTVPEVMKKQQLELEAKKAALSEKRQQEQERHNRAMETAADRRQANTDKREQEKTQQEARRNFGLAKATYDETGKELYKLASEPAYRAADFKDADGDPDKKLRETEIQRLSAEQSKAEEEMNTWKDVAFTKSKDQPAPTTPLQNRFGKDPQMKGMKLGKQTDKGYEVFDKSGKLIGYYE